MHVAVQFYPWSNFYFSLFFIMLIMIRNMKQRKKIEPRIKLNYNICTFRGTSGFSLVQELDFISAFLSFGSSGGYCQISHKTIRVYERLPLLEHGIQLMYPTLLPMLVSLVIITVLKSTGLYCRITCNIFAPLHIRDLKLVP